MSVENWTHSNNNSAHLIAVTSGKGGVGKTNLSVNLSIALAQLGKRVVLMDMDLGMANADILLDVKTEKTLGDIVEGQADIDDVIVDTRYKVKLIPGASGDEKLANLSVSKTRRLMSVLESLNSTTDYIVLDIGAGLSEHTITMTAAADDIIVVTTPEPTAMLDAYAMLKAVHNRDAKAHIHVIMNMARSDKEARSATRNLNRIAEHFISTHLEDDGYVLYDGAVGDAVRKRRPVISEYPDSEASQAIQKIAESLDKRMLRLPIEDDVVHEGLVARMLNAFTSSEVA